MLREEPHGTAEHLVSLWEDPAGELQPPLCGRPHPELLLATSSPPGLAVAAKCGLALQHYFATPTDARDRLAAALRASFREGDHPHVPQAPGCHGDMSEAVAAGAIIGSPAQVTDELGRFIETTGARRIAVYHEAIGDARSTLAPLAGFAEDVRPQLGL